MKWLKKYLSNKQLKMEDIKAAITGIQGWVPDYILTNQELEKKIQRSPEWIMERCGITERRIAEHHMATSDMAAAAINGLLQKKSLNPNDIDLIICATITPDMLTPATACIIADKIGAKNAFGFDLSAACSGFIYGLTTAAQFIQTKMLKKIIVVAADKLSSVTNYEHDNCILFGDAAVAVLVEPNLENRGIIDAFLKIDGSGRDLLNIKAGGSFKPASLETIAAKEHFLFVEGGAVFKSAVASMTDSINRILSKNQLQASDIAWLIPHQANKRIIDAVTTKLNFDFNKVMSNIHKYGNTSAATIPLCLWEWEDKLNIGDNIIISAFGAGFTWGAMYLTWAYEGYNS